MCKLRLSNFIITRRTPELRLGVPLPLPSVINKMRARGELGIFNKTGATMTDLRQKQAVGLLIENDFGHITNREVTENS